MQVRQHTSTFNRRQALLSGLSVLLIPAAAQAQARSDAPLVEVWKSPTCGCCKDWIAHLDANGFRTQVHDSGNTAMRGRLGIDIDRKSVV